MSSCRRSNPFTIFSIDLRSEAIASGLTPCDDIDLRTASSRRDDDLGDTAENADDPFSCESPNNDDERDETDDDNELVNDDDNELDNEEDKAADREDAEAVDK